MSGQPHLITGAFDIAVAQYHLNRGHLEKGDAATALPLLIKSVRHATETGVKFALPWHEALLGYARALTGEVEAGISLLRRALEECEAIRIPYVKTWTSAFFAETLVAGEPEEAIKLAEAGLQLARAGGFQAQEAELLRVKAAALSQLDPRSAKALAEDGLGVGPGLGMRPRSPCVPRSRQHHGKVR